VQPTEFGTHPRLLGVENKVYYVRDVTGEDASRIVLPLPHFFAIARNFALNLYRDQMFENMANSTTMLLCIRHTEANFRMK